MIIPGLCSISFRQLSAEQIVSLCSELKIPTIEWGGDKHVPHGDVDRARKVLALCSDAGIACPSYGSYYRVGISEELGLCFADVLASAEALGVRTIRVWGGDRDYTEYDPPSLEKAVADTRRIADLAGASDMTISFEYHENTLTHTPEAVSAFDKAVNHDNVRYYWQPPHVLNDQACLNSLKDLGDKLTNLHVFQWRLTGFRDPGRRIERRPLEEGAERWLCFFKAAYRDGDRYAFLEFVRGDDPEQLRVDWTVLKDILRDSNN